MMKNKILSIAIILLFCLMSKESFSREKDISPDDYLNGLMQDKRFQKHLDTVKMEVRRLNDNTTLNPEMFEDTLLLGINSLADAIAKKDLGGNYTKDIELAFQYFQKAIEIKPNKPDGFAGLSSVFSFNDDYELAIENILKAIEIKTDDFRLMLQLINYYEQSGNYNLALEWWNKAEKLIASESSFVNSNEHKEVLKMIEEIRNKSKTKY